MSLQILEARQPDFINDWIREYFGPGLKMSTQRLGYGRNPAILVVDFQKGSKLEDLVGRAVSNTAVLLDKARAIGIPILYTMSGYRRDLKDFIPNKIASLRQNIIGTRFVEVLDEVKPREEDSVIIKKSNSAFLATDLMISLNRQSIDTLIITGIHTGGCIRATASDSSSLGFKTIVPEECVGDGKGINPHKANLCDLHVRGADVVSLAEVLRYIDELGPRQILPAPHPSR